MKNIELKVNHEYIISDKSYQSNVTKIRVLELTERTVYYLNLDTPNQSTVRAKKDVFANSFFIIEDLGVNDDK